MNFFARIAVVLLLLVNANAVFSKSRIKGAFSGIVKDAQTGNPIEGASVYISDVKLGSITDKKGFFILMHVSDGKHLVEVSHIGYSTQAFSISIDGDLQKEILLQPTIVENNAVVVTGVTKATQLKNIPFQVSVMKKQDLLQTSSMNIIESITKKAGISSISTGPAISKPIIRGLGYNRVLTVNDGVRQEGQQWGDEHGIEIDEASVNKIEVLKGPASLVYGSDAMAGVINIISNVPAPNNTIKSNIGSNYQSNNQLRSVNGNISGNKYGINWNLYGTLKAATDYQNKYDGYVFNSKFNEHNAGGYIGYNSSWGYSHLLLSNFDMKAGLVEGKRDSTTGNFVKSISQISDTIASNADFTSVNPNIPYQHIRHFKIATDNAIKIGANHLSINVGWQENQREEFGNPDNTSERALYFDMKTITYAAQFHCKDINGFKTSFGINGMNQSNVNLGLEQLIPDYLLSDAGVFVFVQKEYHTLNISGGIRFDQRNIQVQALKEGGLDKGEAFTKQFGNFSGSVGVTYPFNNHINAKLNLASAYRAPSIPELAANGAHEGTIRYEYGNKNLQSETSTQIDASVELNYEHFSFNLAGYFNQFNNFIFYQKLQIASGADSMVNGLSAFQFNQQKANVAGVEVTLDIHPHPLDWLHVENTFSYVRGYFQESIEGSNNLPFIPAPKLLTEIRADRKSLSKLLQNAYFKIEMENTFDQNNAFTAYNTESASSGYTIFNLGLGADICNQKSHPLFSLFITASNITDVAYQNHLSRLKYADTNNATGRRGVFNVGRNIGVKLLVPLSFEWK